MEMTPKEMQRAYAARFSVGERVRVEFDGMDHAGTVVEVQEWGCALPNYRVRLDDGAAPEDVWWTVGGVKPA